MKYFAICALAALVLIQASSAFKVKRVIYVVPATTASTTTVSPSTTTTVSSSTTTTAAPPVVVQVVYCSWKNNWCRSNANSVRNCKWGLCKFNG
ncbi:uncharacterized protein LOC128257635 [Drosophila gunungcola]|uniref:Uncharacterized protein n=1 Tax=Drosophila gunungcola TaxID=103775 RepID=A0A9P9YQU0_9MUSC|nr:uncharacterized protein LOC128257635 [Drosophila gunungcola]KAI8041485.1 hypothetical protein M5D96_005750 [Drosophila gunungcola]